MSKNLLATENARMRKLMGFTYKDNSHEVLSEENIKRSLLLEQPSEQKVKEDAQNFGYQVISKYRKAIPAPRLQSLNNPYYANFVSVQRGLTPAGLTQLNAVVAQIQQIITDGIDPNSIQITIDSSADNSTATTAVSTPPGAPLDHPGGQPYLGWTPDQIATNGNRYLASARGRLVRTFLSQQLNIPVTNFIVRPTVNTQAGAQFRNVSFQLKFTEPDYEVGETRPMKAHITLNANYYTQLQWNEWQKKKGSDCRIIEGKPNGVRWW